MNTGSSAGVRVLPAAEARRRIGELAALLVDAVRHGASVNFLAGFGPDEADAFWTGQLAGVEAGDRLILAGESEGRLLGTVVLTLAPQPNAPHRAEVGKMLVLSGHRRQGLGRRLLAAAEDEARARGRWLLLLETESGSAGDLLYRSCGWTAFGGVPDHALRPDGQLAETTMFFKDLRDGASSPVRQDRNTTGPGGKPTPS